MPRLRLSVAGKLISLVAKEIASNIKSFAESRTSAVQANLNGIETDTKDFNDLAVFQPTQLA
jgi:hypothetical protein